MKKLLLIDGMAAAYRAYYAIPGLRTSHGLPSNAVFGFIQILRKLIDDFSPAFAAVAADSPEPTFRHRRFEEYKARRKPMPDDLVIQLPFLRRAAEGYRLPWLAVPAWEADDIIAVLARRAEMEGIETVIVTGDKDLLQLISDRVKVVSPQREGQVFDAEAVREKYGVPPARIADYLALVGDSTDNIPGIPGIGPKTASALLREHGSLEGVLAAAPELNSRGLGEKLSRFADSARRVLKLIELGEGLEMKVEWESLRRKEPDYDILRVLFRELEFSRLLEELPKEKIPDPNYHSLAGNEEIKKWLAGQPAGGEWMIGVGVSADGLPLQLRFSALALSPASGQGVFLDLQGGGGEELEALAPLFQEEKAAKCCYDSKLLRHLLLNRGLTLEGVAWDTRLAAYLLDPSRSDYRIENLAWDFLKRSFPSESGELPIFKTEGKETSALFCARTEILWDLKSVFSRELEEKGLADLLYRVELPLAAALAGMERAGIAVDLKVLARMSEEIELDLTRLAEEMFALAGESFNLNSPRQLSRVLFEKLGLPPQKRIKTGHSTDFGVLKKLASFHPLPEKLLSYRQLFKLKSTYIDPLPKLVDPETGRLHTTFNQTATSTGRLSSSNPNLQNIPIRSELGKKLREAFIPSSPDWWFLSADYSQIDLRILAHLSGDELLREAFEKDQDIHAFTASQIFGVPLAEVSAEMRRRAKTVNFGIIYGMEAWGLSEELEISSEEARRFIETYFLRYSGVAGYIRRLIAEAREKGYVTTIFGRRRYLPEIEARQDSVRRFGERTAVNTPIQGSAADIIKLAMVAIDRRLRERRGGSRMLLQIHDELVFEAPPEELDALEEMVKSEMEGVVQLKVKLKIELGRGKNWGEL